jgi:putative peptidoglycan lipid II flippase
MKTAWVHRAFRSGRGVASAVVALSLLRMTVRIGGFGEKQALAYLFGASGALDAFFVAVSVPLMIWFTAAGVMEPVLAPMLVKRAQGRDETAAFGAAKAWLLVVGACGLIAATFGFLFPGAVAAALAPGFSDAQHATCARMVRVTSPLWALFACWPVLALINNARRRFAAAPLAELVLKGIFIAAVLGTAAFPADTALPAAFVAASVVGSAVFAVALLANPVFRGAPLRLSRSEFRAALLLMAAPGVGALSSRIGGIVENAACSTLAAGSVSSLEFARKIVNLPLLILPVAVGTVLLTVFSEMSGAKDAQAVGALLARGVQTMAFLFIPLAGLTIALAGSVVAVVYERGHFDAATTVSVAGALVWLAPTIVLIAMEVPMLHHFFARHDLWPPVFVGLANVGLRIALIAALLPVWGLIGVAAAITAGRFLKMLLLSWVLCRRGGFSFRQLGLVETAKLTAAGVVCGTAAAGARVMAPPPAALLGHLALLAACSAVGLAAYAATAAALRSEEMINVLRRGKCLLALQTPSVSST